MKAKRLITIVLAFALTLVVVQVIHAASGQLPAPQSKIETAVSPPNAHAVPAPAPIRYPVTAYQPAATPSVNPGPVPAAVPVPTPPHAFAVTPLLKGNDPDMISARGGLPYSYD
jgi:hypothetical protein